MRKTDSSDVDFYDNVFLMKFNLTLLVKTLTRAPVQMCNLFITEIMEFVTIYLWFEWKGAQYVLSFLAFSLE